MGKDLTIILKNGLDKKITTSSGTVVKELLTHIPDNKDYIAAKVNNEITSLSFPLKIDCSVEFITNSDQHGMIIYRRGLSFLLEKVTARIFPDNPLVIGHSLGPGYYFELENKTISAKEVKNLEEEMHEEVEKDIPIYREKISYMKALEHFKNMKRDDKYKLISGFNMSKLTIYRCEDFFQVLNWPTVDRTGVLKTFSLIYYPPGFILQFPRKSAPDKVAKFVEQKKISEVYREYREWGKVLKIDTVGCLNGIISNHQIRNFIQVAEALHAKKVDQLATEIYNRRKNVRLICIAGPSSSGKTTFSKRLAIQLQTLKLKPVTISVDNYFVDRNKTPLNEDGTPNYETIDALNLELLNEHLRALLNGEEINLPKYNFITGKSTLDKKTMKINEDEIIVIEGIHCLNEKLTYVVPKKNKYKIYVSVLTQMNIDNNNRIPTTDNRLIRRMVRDYKYRGHSAIDTMKMWPGVRKGEEKYIFPFQNDADGYFNSALDYELGILRANAEPLLLQIKPYHEEYAEAQRLLKMLSYFLFIQPKDVPATSILCEFIGGSFFFN